MNRGLVRFTKRLLDLMYYGGILLTVGIPLIFYQVGFYLEVFHRYYTAQCMLYMISGVFCILIVWELRKMFETVLKDRAFVRENGLPLRRMGRYSFLTALMSVIRLPIAFTPSTVFIIAVFFIAGLFCFVLGQVFEQAVSYKEENDLTI